MPTRAGAARRVDHEMGEGHRWSLVTAGLDTLLTALYVLIDDHVIRSGQRRPGHPKKLSDAELVCLAAAQVLRGARRGITGSFMRTARRAARFPAPAPARAAAAA